MFPFQFVRRCKDAAKQHPQRTRDNLDRIFNDQAVETSAVHRPDSFVQVCVAAAHDPVFQFTDKDVEALTMVFQSVIDGESSEVYHG